MKKTTFLFVAVVLLASLFHQSGFAAEEYDGKPVHDKSCLSCHKTEMYQRTPLFVKSFRQLDAQVNACAKRNKISWSEDQTEDVIDYLCDAFYGFE